MNSSKLSSGLRAAGTHPEAIVNDVMSHGENAARVLAQNYLDTAGSDTIIHAILMRLEALTKSSDDQLEFPTNNSDMYLILNFLNKARQGRGVVILEIAARLVSDAKYCETPDRQLAVMEHDLNFLYQLVNDIKVKREEVKTVLQDAPPTEEENRALAEVEEKLGAKLDPNADPDDVILTIRAKGYNWVFDTNTKKWVEKAQAAKRYALSKVQAAAAPVAASAPKRSRQITKPLAAVPVVTVDAAPVAAEEAPVPAAAVPVGALAVPVAVSAVAPAEPKTPAERHAADVAALFGAGLIDRIDSGDEVKRGGAYHDLETVFIRARSEGTPVAIQVSLQLARLMAHGNYQDTMGIAAPNPDAAFAVYTNALLQPNCQPAQARVICDHIAENTKWDAEKMSEKFGTFVNEHYQGLNREILFAIGYKIAEFLEKGGNRLTAFEWAFALVKVKLEFAGDPLYVRLHAATGGGTHA